MKRHWLIIPGLILLNLIPIISGSLRLTQLAGGPAIIPEADRFTDFPWPVTIHIVSATLYSIVGAFQFVPALRRGRQSWHRLAGRVLIPAGFLVALSGMWMGAFSDLPLGDGPLLMIIREFFGALMLVSLAFGIRALARREFSSHGEWMIRAYAIGVGAGTQAILLIPVSLTVGSSHEFGRATAIALAWIVNLAVAELVIRRSRLRSPRGPARVPVTV